MKMKLFSVLDMKTGVYGVPVFDIRKESVIRSFADRVNMVEQNNMWNKHPEDFALYMVGEFDDETAIIKPLKIECLVSASAVKSMSGNGQQYLNLEDVKEERIDEKQIS